MPPRSPTPRSRSQATASPGPAQDAEELAGTVQAFLEAHTDAVVREDGAALFDLREASWSVTAQAGRCTLHLWDSQRNLVRRVLGVAARPSTLRISTQPFGATQPTSLEIAAPSSPSEPTSREAARRRYLKLLERVLAREFDPWTPLGFRTAMDLEHSFGPAYARGSLVKGREAWAVIGVGEHEHANIVDGILTLGILWLHECRARAGGRRLYVGLRIIVPQGQAALTHARLPWLNEAAAQWELLELNEREETLVARDPQDQGNLRTALVHRPDATRAHERFGEAIERVREMVPEGDWDRVEQHLRSPTELAFLLHGLPFARARVRLEEASFRHRLEVLVGAGAGEQPLIPETQKLVADHVARLFARRKAHSAEADYGLRGLPEADGGRDRRIGSGALGSAHRRTPAGRRFDAGPLAPARDPLFRAVPERWLESVLRADLAPLTRHLAPAATQAGSPGGEAARAADDDSRGNRAADEKPASPSGPVSRLIPRLNPAHVYTQVPAIAGASDRGLLDLLGVTEDGRLAVIELKTEDDLHFALQGLDYWIRVRQHHGSSPDPATGLGEFQRHGYFTDTELSPLAPRLYLVAPALHVHPATETVLRYLSPRVEWHLLALDERWRQQVRVVWRKSSLPV